MLSYKGQSLKLVCDHDLVVFHFTKLLEKPSMYDNV